MALDRIGGVGGESQHEREVPVDGERAQWGVRRDPPAATAPIALAMRRWTRGDPSLPPCHSGVGTARGG